MLAGEARERCAECSAPLASGQRYCLACGARVVDRDAQLEALLERVGGGAAAAGDPAQATPVPVAGALGVGGLRLPGARVSALLVLAFVGFGILLGTAARSEVKDRLAAARAPVRVMLPAPAAAAASPESPSSAGSESPSSAGSEAPASEATPTPATEASTPAPAAAGKTPASAGPSAGEGSSGGSSGEAAAGGPASKLPAIKHVFVIMLSQEPYASVFGPASPAPYLSQTLERRGALLVHYDAVAHEQLADGLAVLSGQGPTVQTAANCTTYADIAPARRGADEQVMGSGCVYPAGTETVLGQLTAKHLSARAYIEGLDEAGTPLGACGHPAQGASDPTSTQAPDAGAYATFRNPLVYFHSVIDSPACAKEDVGLGHLPSDLAAGAHAPSLLYIAPDNCHDGNPMPCAPGSPAGMVPAQSFLKQWVPRILASRPYKDGGLLVITVDEAPSSGEFADSSSCCGQPAYPNLAAAPPSGHTGRGGGAVGALLLSPFIGHASTSQEPYNHFSLLRTIEDVFGLSHLGYAALPAVKPFEPGLFSSSGG